jgi:hypothetical protein
VVPQLNILVIVEVNVQQERVHAKKQTFFALPSVIQKLVDV